MFRLLARRLALVVPTFIGVTLLGFLLIHSIPGDAVEARGDYDGNGVADFTVATGTVAIGMTDILFG